MIPDSPAPLFCLHIAFPQALEADVLDTCQAIPDLPGLTVIAADGFGQGARMRTIRETVLGRAERRLLLIVADLPTCDRVISTLCAALPTPEAAYWIVAVVQFGRFA